jgi:hypothetical protein
MKNWYIFERHKIKSYVRVGGWIYENILQW